MADKRSALIRVRIAESRLKRAFDLSQSAREDPSQRNLFLATVRDLENIKEQFETDCVAVEAAIGETDVDVAEHASRMEAFDDKYFQIRAVVAGIEDSKVQPSSQPQSQVSKPRVALPKISLPSFDGSPQQWPNFSNLFSTLITNNSELSPVEKLAYLRSALSGEPLGMISSLTMSNANFDVAWKLLAGRYENKRLVVAIHVDALLHAPAVTSDSPKALRQLLTSITESISALTALDVPVTQWDLILLPILCKRLDSFLQTQWEMSLTNEFPTVSDFVKFLEKHCRAQEAVAQSRGKSSGLQPPMRKSSPPFAGWKQSRGQALNSLVSSSQTCGLCGGPHALVKCSKFNQSDPKDRYTIVKRQDLCLNCLSPAHRAKGCPSSACRHCGARHHTLLHFKQQPPEGSCASPEGSCASPEGFNALSTEANSATVAVTAAAPSCSKTVLLSTAQVNILDRTGTPFVVRALLDTASQASFISEKCVQNLRLTRRGAHLPIQGLSNTPVNVAKSYVSVVITPVGILASQFALDVFVLPRITSSVPGTKLSDRVRKSVAHLHLADPAFDTPGPVDLLIGADLVPYLMKGGKIDGSPVALDSVLGWILMGKVETEQTSTNMTSLCVSLVTSHPPLPDVMRRFWEIEEFTLVKHQSPEDVHCEELFVKSYTRHETGRYSVALPFCQPEPELGSSRPQAINRLLRLERRLKGDPALKQKYSEFMEDYLAMGHMERVAETEMDCAHAFYIPHHAVVKPDSSTTKVRVVFDASAKSSTGVSLNDTLLTGPKLQQDIFNLLLSFRLHVVVFTADVKQMYRQIHVHRHHQDYQRIVWRSSDAAPVQDYRLKTVTYGVSSAPFLALRTLKQLAEDEREQFPTASRVLLSDVYVDDVVTGAPSVDSAVAMHQELIKLLAKGGFQLRKFMSNHQTLLNWLPAEDIETLQPLALDQDSCTVIKVLGLQWNPTSDTYSYKVRASACPATKRTILSNVVRIFDPLGWLTPISMFAKCLIQVLWVQNLDWDAKPPPNILDSWNKFNSQLPLLSALNISRLVRGKQGCSYQLHGFSDSSELGYAASVYLRVVDVDGTITVHLLAGKSKVAPVKAQSLPRLELCGALLLSRLLRHMINVHGMELEFTSIVAWTDSQVALAWIHSSSHELKTFVANRVSEIQDLTPSSWWRHVRSEHNPADCGSRGLLPAQILDHHLWWTGPAWLKLPADEWPASASCSDISDLVQQEKKSLALATILYTEDIDSLVERFSSLMKLLRVTAYILRFVANCRHSQSARESGTPCPRELETALNFWILRVQSMVFKDDLASLRKNKRTSPQIRKLHPFLDSDGFLRVGGRLDQSKLPFQHKHPALLPKSNPLTSRIIQHYHNVNQHPGIQALQSILREKFWILSDKQAITSCVHRCLKCFKAQPPTFTPLMGSLPAMRVQQVKPFSKAGVDYAGPFFIKLARVRKVTLLKAYLCIFVCCTTKAVHVELASDLSTEVFLAAYKRFIARRGRSSDLYSDCGTNFVGAHNQLTELQRMLSSSSHQQTVVDCLAPFGVRWHFNPPAAPHFGGLWEAAVKAFKSHLNRVIGEQILSFEELYTVVVQVEAILNSRPLCPLSSDPNDLRALTPGHFLTMEPLVSHPEPELEQVQLNRLQRWQLVSRLHQDFWHRWHREYLHTLQQRSKWQDQTIAITPNQLVLIKEDRVPPLQWKLGRVLHLHPGSDGVPRVATVRTTSGSLKRPVVKLCPLPLE